MEEKIKAIIVDDNKGAITDLQNMLKTHCANIEVLATYEYSSDALKDVNLGKIKPELLFLDIQMDNDRINGLELFELILKADPNYCNAIFVTGFDKFLHQALRLNALDYLIKPVNKEELISAVEKQQYQKPRHLVQRVKGALDYSKNAVTAETNITIKDGNNISFIKLFDICYCKSAGNYAEIYTNDGDMTFTNYPLKKLEEMLPESHFIRCHNEYIIGGIQVKQFKNTVRNCFVIIDVNKQKKEIPISRSKKDDMMDFLRGFSIN